MGATRFHHRRQPRSRTPACPLDEIEDALQRSVAMQNARGILVRKQQKMTGRPMTPLHKGHVGLLACSGMLNGFFGEGETRHIAHCDPHRTGMFAD